MYKSNNNGLNNNNNTSFQDSMAQQLAERRARMAQQNQQQHQQQDQNQLNNNNNNVDISDYEMALRLQREYDNMNENDNNNNNNNNNNADSDMEIIDNTNNNQGNHNDSPPSNTVIDEDYEIALRLQLQYDQQDSNVPPPNSNNNNNNNNNKNELSDDNDDDDIDEFKHDPKVNNRFVTQNPIDWVRPRSDFHTSNFCTQYKAFSKHSVNDKTVRDCLPYNVQQLFDKFPSSYTTEQKCIRVWTLNSNVHRKLTQALYQDNEYQIKKYIALIRGINKYLVSPTNKEYITYRGSHMTEKQFNVYKAGNIYRAPSFGATTQNEAVAMCFSKRYSIKFIIPKNCWNAAPISHLSASPNENEVLLPAYTAFKVLSKSSNQIKVQVLDNKEVDYCVESRFI